MSKTGRYIYGVINAGVEECFGLSEVAGSVGDSLSKYGEDVVNSNKFSNHAYTVTFRDISAVVSDAEVVDYNHMSKHALASLLLRHQTVIERIMARYTIIPMRLGTFADNNEEVKEILTKGYRKIKGVFERAANTVEIDVVATLSDFDSFLQQVSEMDEIKQLKQSLLDKPQGVAVQDQMKVGVLVKKHLDRKIEEYVGQIQSVLNEIAEDFKPHDRMDDKMVLNTAFLIDQSKQKDFEQKIAELNGKFEEKLNFRCVGPLPPYSFYTLKVKKAQFEEVDWAKKKLGLKDDLITASDIKKAHRRLALTCHPDKNRDVPGIEKKFADMTKAYQILLDYYQVSDSAGQGNGCYFDEETFDENAVLVTTVE